VAIIIIVLILIGGAYFVYGKKGGNIQFKNNKIQNDQSGQSLSDNLKIGGVCEDSNIVFTIQNKDCKNPIGKEIVFTANDWEKYLDANKNDLIAKFDLNGNREWKCSDNERYWSYPDTKNKNECMKAYSPSSFLGVLGNILLSNDKIYFIASGMMGFEYSEVFVVGVYDFRNRSFSVLGDKLIGGDGTIYNFKTSKGNYIAAFSNETGSGAGIITGFYVFDIDSDQELFVADDNLQIKSKDQELMDKILPIIRESVGDIKVKFILPKTGKEGCGEESKRAERFESGKEYIIKWNFYSRAEMKFPLKTDIFLRKIKGWDDNKDDAIYEDFPLVSGIDTKMGENQYSLYFPEQYKGEERSYVVIKFNHPIEYYGSINYDKEQTGKGKFIEFESNIMCVQ